MLQLVSLVLVTIVTKAQGWGTRSVTQAHSNPCLERQGAGAQTLLDPSTPVVLCMTQLHLVQWSRIIEDKKDFK
jgi:hypothetical protein